MSLNGATCPCCTCCGLVSCEGRPLWPNPGQTHHDTPLFEQSSLLWSDPVGARRRRAEALHRRTPGLVEVIAVATRDTCVLRPSHTHQYQMNTFRHRCMCRVHVSCTCAACVYMTSACIHMRTRVCVTDGWCDVENGCTWTPSWRLRAMSCRK